MNNGEGTREGEVFIDVAPPDPLDEFLSWEGPKSDAGDASPVMSDYSSCGESDFDRYCSANSVMGTASLCSSLGTCNDFLDSDLGSVRSLGFGEDRALENVGFGARFQKNSADTRSPSFGGFDYSSDGRVEFCKGKGEVGNSFSALEDMVFVGFSKRSKSLPRYEENSSIGAIFSENNVEKLKISNFVNGSESLRSSGVNTTLPKDEAEGLTLRGHSDSAEHVPSKDITTIQNDEEMLPHFGVVNASDVLQSGEDFPSSVASWGENFTKLGPSNVGQSHESISASGVSVDGKEGGKLTQADEETPTRYENSDDERSSVDYGTDDEQSSGLSDRINLRYSQKGKIDDENPLLINSTAAFGLDDWDNFEQEAEESNLTPVLFDETHIETERNLLSSTLGPLTVSSIFGGSEQVGNIKEIPIDSFHVQDTNQSAENIECCSVSNVFTLQDLSVQNAPAGIDFNIIDGTTETELHYISDKQMRSLDKSEVSKGDLLGKSDSQFQLDPLSNMAIAHLRSMAAETPQDNVARDLQNDVKNGLTPMVQSYQETFLKRTVIDFSVSKDPGEEHVTSNEAENLKLNEFYDEVVHEMEEILLDSVGSPGARFNEGNRASVSESPKPFRDGSLTASTSGTNDAYPQVQQPLKIDGIEVLGAKQKKGEVSLGERLVGVKEYTVYRLRVWSGKDHWEVERRYRDFVSLYRQLKTFFAAKGQVLPSPWSGVERESRNIFGNASPDVVTRRSALIQDCLQSIRHSVFSFSTSSPLIWFLSPQKAFPSSYLLNTSVPHSPSAYSGETSTQGASTLGKTISLLVEVPPHKSMRQLLETQHYLCAGCHRYFDKGKTMLKEFVETFGWGKPRLCEYTGQLFCASCHTNDTAILPARVLHFWDFTQYPVSQLAKSYLESIYEQPMLCVSAVNPFLFSKVPTLLHIMGLRKKIGAMLPYVHCPFRRSINRGLGSRRYLVESNDFFALRDLVDLSKGAFAALPVMVENVWKQISEHITERCLICCDVGVPCGAGQACEDPSSLIFPFQEDEVEKCRSCESTFHKTCFRKLRSCRCGADLNVERHGGPTTDTVQCKVGEEVDGSLDLSARKSNTGSTVGFLTGLFSRVGSENTADPREKSAVIVMGSLPSVRDYWGKQERRKKVMFTDKHGLSPESHDQLLEAEVIDSAVAVILLS